MEDVAQQVFGFVEKLSSPPRPSWSEYLQRRGGGATVSPAELADMQQRVNEAEQFASELTSDWRKQARHQLLLKNVVCPRNATTAMLMRKRIRVPPKLRQADARVAVPAYAPCELRAQIDHYGARFHTKTLNQLLKGVPTRMPRTLK